MTGRVHHHQLRHPPLLLCLQGNPDFSTLGVKISKLVHVARNMYLSLTSRSFAAVLTSNTPLRDCHFLPEGRN